MGISPLFQLLPSGAVHFPFPRVFFFFFSFHPTRLSGDFFFFFFFFLSFLMSEVLH